MSNYRKLTNLECDAIMAALFVSVAVAMLLKLAAIMVAQLTAGW